MTPSALHRLAALLDGPDPWPEVLPAVEAEPITSAQRERLLRVFDATAGGSPSAPPRAARGRMETIMDPTYAILRSPRQGAPFALLMTGGADRVIRAFRALDVRQGTAELVYSAGSETLATKSGPNLRSRW